MSPSELIEDARLSATSPHARGLWVNAMVTMISGWAYPWDDGSPIHPPPDCYWHDAARWWAAKVKQPPPEDLVAALAADPELGGYQIFVREACRLTEDRTEAPDP